MYRGIVSAKDIVFHHERRRHGQNVNRLPKSVRLMTPVTHQAGAIKRFVPKGSAMFCCAKTP